MFPRELTDLPQWVVFRVTYRPDGKKNAMPHNPRTFKPASHSDSRTWGTYGEAVQAIDKSKDPNLHLGFALMGFVGIDFDEPINDAERKNHARIYNAVVSYTEHSLSGKGVHIICHGNIPYAVKRNHVEIYIHPRFFIMTGNHVTGRPTTIENCNEVINGIVEQAGSVRATAIEHDEDQKKSDEDVFMQCTDSSNGAKFRLLWNGEWGNYSSQSEADFALINMLAFATHNNEQTRRLFRYSYLGRRDKADRDDYLNGMIGRIRAEQNPQIDFIKFKPPEFIKEPRHLESEFKFPDGLVGEMAQYTLDTAVKPVAEIALAGSLGLMSGIAGRTYNISNTGLNLYYLVITGTGVGKEGAVQGMQRIIKAVAKKTPSVTQFIGPEDYASGQALVKRLERTPCYISPMGEFGTMLKRICNPNAISSDLMWRKLFLQLFNKSGPTDTLGELVYSDQGKNTAAIDSPAFSIIGDSTAETIFENLSDSVIRLGLIPRFTLIEAPDYRPPTNPNFGLPPHDYLIRRVEHLCVRSMSMSANNSRQPITVDPCAKVILRDFDEEIDAYINAERDNAARQIWSRSYVKAVRLAGLVAVGMNMDSPNVTRVEAEWGIDFARRDAQQMLRRFGDGVGGGDTEQIARLRTIIINTLKAAKTPRKFKDMSVVSHGLISPRAYGTACFKEDRLGAGNALTRALRALSDNGEIIELSKKDTSDHFMTTARCYFITKHFQSR